MTEDREFEGKDLDEALCEAAAALGVDRDELHYEMTEQGRRGLLGLGTKNVRIRVKPPIDAELPADDPEEAPATGRRKAGPRRESKPRKAAGSRSGRKPMRKPAERSTSAKADAAGGEPTDVDAATRETSSPDPVEREGAAAPVAETALEAAVVEEVRSTVQRMTGLMGLELETTAGADGSSVQLSFEGADEKQLRARDGELGSALEFLLNRMLRRTWPAVGRIDMTGGQASRPRDAELLAMARKVAKQVAKTGKTRKLRPLNAYERRLVHLTIREFSGLSSSSDGSGAMKCVRISKVRNQI